MNTLWHRLLPRSEIREHLSGAVQSRFCTPLRSSKVSAMKDTVDLEQAMVWCVWSDQVFPLLQRDGGLETFDLRAEVDGGIAVTVHADDSRAAQTAATDITSYRTRRDVYMSGEICLILDYLSRDVLNWNICKLDCDERSVESRILHTK